MATCKTSNTFLQRREGKRTFNDDSDPPGSHRRESGSSSQSRFLDIGRAERTAMIRRAERLRDAERVYAAQKAHSDTVLERLGLSVQPDTLPSPQPPAYPWRRPESSLQGGRIRPILDLEENRGRTAKTIRTSDEDDPFFEQKLHLGRQIAILSGKVAYLTEKNRSPSPDSSISSVDTHTPESFSPSPPPTAAPRRATRIPVMPRKLGGAGKEVANKGRLQEKMEEVQLFYHPSPRPPTAPRRTPAVTPMVPTPPSKAAPPKRKGPRPGKTLRPATAGNGVAREDLQPFADPLTSMSLCFSHLSSEQWDKKVDGLKSVRTLARHHPEVLRTKLHEVCLILADEVLNLRSVVACAAINAIEELHVQLGKAMDSKAEWIGHALLQKLAQTTNAFIHKQVNLALDALVEGCSPSRIMNALLNTGLDHRCVALRCSAAQHLHQLTVILGKDRTLTAGKVFAERLLTAISKMSVDGALEVRNHGLKMLQGLSTQKEFLVLWNKLIPEKDKFPLNKILKKSRQ